ncbi:MAG TPA: class I SAM-dependent methyltransferase [Vicinamibacterales bacterium]|jgi:SAM-dependent methyltransferase|nr:class I SAM-dependent methyltransferase [Vicinamibacterales bacterium]
MTVRANVPATEWGRRASTLYQREYAQQYRAHDEALGGVAAFVFLSEWIGRVAASCPPRFSALDLGCGTGRYFWAIQGAAAIVGIDASAAMLEQARQPLDANRISATSIQLIEGDLLTYPFEARSFDLVYAIGVLAEHSPLDGRVVSNVARWLKPGGGFAFTTVHPDSPSIPRTVGRTLGHWMAPLTGGALRRSLRRALLSGGLYADEMRVRELLTPSFDIESLSTFESEAHLHCVCVARKPS